MSATSDDITPSVSSSGDSFVFNTTERKDVKSQSQSDTKTKEAARQSMQKETKLLRTKSRAAQYSKKRQTTLAPFSQDKMDALLRQFAAAYSTSAIMDDLFADNQVAVLVAKKSKPSAEEFTAAWNRLMRQVLLRFSPSPQAWLLRLHSLLINYATDDETKSTVSQIFTNAAAGYSVYSSEVYNEEVYQDIKTQVLAKILKETNLNFRSDLKLQLRTLAYIAVNFLDAEKVNIKDVNGLTLKDRFAQMDDYSSAKILAVSKFVFDLITRPSDGVREAAMTTLMRTFAENLFDDPAIWLREIDVLPVNRHEYLYRYMELFVRMTSEASSRDNVEDVKNLLSAFGSQLSQPTLDALRKVGLRVDAQENTLNAVLFDVKAELKKSTVNALDLRKELSKVKRELDASEQAVDRLQNVALSYKNLSAAYIRNFKFLSLSARKHILSLLELLTSVVDRDILVGAVGIIGVVNFFDSDRYREFESVLIDARSRGVHVDVLVDSLESFASLLDSNAQTTWNAVLEKAKANLFEEVQPLLFVYLSAQLKVDNVAELRALASSSNSTEEAWAQAFTSDDGIDEEKLEVAVAKMKEAAIRASGVAVQKVQEYDVLRKEMERNRGELDKLNSQLETLNVRRRQLEENLRVQAASRSSLQQQIDAVDAEDDRLEQRALDAIQRNAVDDDLFTEKDEIRKRKSQLNAQAGQIDGRISNLNAELLSVGNTLARARRQIEENLRERNEREARLQASESDINRSLREMKVPLFTNTKEMTPLTIQWFDDVKRAVADFYMNDYRPAKAERDRLRRQHAEMSNQVGALQKANTDLTAIVTRLTTERNELEANIAKMTNSVTLMYTRLAGAQANDKLTFDEKLRAIEALAPVSVKLEVAATAAAVNSSLQTEKVQLGASMEDTRQQLNDLLARITELEETNGVLEPLTQQLQRDVSELNEEKLAQVEEVEKLNAQIDQLRGEADSLNAQIARLTQEQIVGEQEYKDKLESLTRQNQIEIVENSRLVSRLQMRIEFVNAALRSDNYERVLRSNLERAHAKLKNLRQRAKQVASREIERAEDEVATYEFLYRISEDNPDELDNVEEKTRPALEAARINAADLEKLRRELQATLKSNHSDISSQSAALRELSDRLQAITADKRNVEREVMLQKRQLSAKNEELERRTNALTVAENTLNEYRRSYERATRTIEEQRVAFKKLQAAQRRTVRTQENLASQLNMTPEAIDDMTQLIEGDSFANETLSQLSSYIQGMPEEISSQFEAASSVTDDIDDFIAAATSKIDSVGGEVVRTAVEFDKKKTALMMQAQRPSVQIMSATEVPTFTRFVPAAPRVEITNTYTAQTPGASLLTLDDSYDYFSEYMTAVLREEDIPASIIDRFYVFASMVQGRVASTKPFWLPRHEGIKALVAHAIEAATKSSTSRVPLSMVKEKASILSKVREVILEANKNNATRLNAGTAVRASVYDRIVVDTLNELYAVSFSVSATNSTIIYRDVASFTRDLFNNITERLEVEQEGFSVQRPSQLAVVQYIKTLFKRKMTEEIDRRRAALDDMATGERIFSILVSMLDKTFFAAFQTALQAAKIPLSLTDPNFVGCLHDSVMADYVAVFYNQAFARSRHTVTSKRTTLFDTQASFVRTALNSYRPPKVEMPTIRATVKTAPIESYADDDDDKSYLKEEPSVFDFN